MTGMLCHLASVLKPPVVLWATTRASCAYSKPWRPSCALRSIGCRRRVCLARLLGATTALRTTLGAPVVPVDRPLLEQTRSACAAALGDTAFAAAWAEGTAMTQERAIAQAASSPTEGAEEKETLLAFATRAAKAL
jgi:hypothetical protein